MRLWELLNNPIKKNAEQPAPQVIKPVKALESRLIVPAKKPRKPE
jgi:hypothetical protein